MTSNKELPRIITMLQNAFDGSAWHGASVMDILNRVTPELAIKKSKHIHRICELVSHMTTWRIYALKQLLGEYEYDVSQKENWKEFSTLDESTWVQTKRELVDSQQLLIEALQNISDEKLDDPVHGKSFSYYTMIHGVIQHDLYHLGEIALLSRELND